MSDIGSWFTVLNILGFAAVLTNATVSRAATCVATGHQATMRVDLSGSGTYILTDTP
jgi:hypothetical protein